jgi:hypothetical protein
MSLTYNFINCSCLLIIFVHVFSELPKGAIFDLCRNDDSLVFIANYITFRTNCILQNYTVRELLDLLILSTCGGQPQVALRIETTTGPIVHSRSCLGPSGSLGRNADGCPPRP